MSDLGFCVESLDSQIKHAEKRWQWLEQQHDKQILDLPILGFLASPGFWALLTETLELLQPSILQIAMSPLTSKCSQYFAFPGMLPKQLL